MLRIDFTAFHLATTTRAVTLPYIVLCFCTQKTFLSCRFRNDRFFPLSKKLACIYIYAPGWPIGRAVGRPCIWIPVDHAKCDFSSSLKKKWAAVRALSFTQARRSECRPQSVNIYARVSLRKRSKQTCAKTKGKQGFPRAKTKTTKSSVTALVGVTK